MPVYKFNCSPLTCKELNLKIFPLLAATLSMRVMYFFLSTKSEQRYSLSEIKSSAMAIGRKNANES